MPVRKAKAVWEGGLRQGKGVMELQSQAFQGPYSYPSRFEEGEGTNPEELIAAAHAGCFSMALAASLEREGFPRSGSPPRPGSTWRWWTASPPSPGLSF